MYRDNGYSTQIRLGKYDYKVYRKKVSDKRPWKEIAPLLLPKEIINFEIGDTE